MNEIATSPRYNRRSTAIPLAHRWARKLVKKLLSGLHHGRIIIHDNGKETSFGHDDSITAHIWIHDTSVYHKVLFAGSIGAGEAYVDGLWDTDDLTALSRIMVRNMELLDKMEEGLAWLLRPFHLLNHLLRRNSRQQARKNIISHYDLGNEMYSSFLDPTMMYSSAIYDPQATSLEAAAVNKLDIICRKLNLTDSDRIIEIGSGWGGFAIHAASRYGCQVTTTTLSDAQYEEAARRIAAAGLSDRITLLKKDYRDLRGTFDKLVSIEMIEAVGDRFLPDFFRKCGELLNDNGMMLLQAITLRDQNYKKYLRSVDFIQRHIFPGGCLVSNRRMTDLLAEQTDMVLRQLDDFGFDYARTLKDWRRRFQAAFSSLRRKGYDETFRRLWEYYLCYCEGGFRERAISVVHLVASKPANRQVVGR